MRICLQTDIPSPYQIELFDELAKRVSLAVIYTRRVDPCRHWGATQLNHIHLFLDTDQTRKLALQWVSCADLVIFTQYAHRPVRALMNRRHASRQPWCFWAERPGATGKSPILGKVARRILLRSLRSSTVPIWGIGTWGVLGYRAEFGSSRKYYNVPYFSNLSRFDAAFELRSVGLNRTVLFAGRLMRRKGFDIFLEALSRALDKADNLRALVAGTGELEATLKSSRLLKTSKFDVLGPRTYAEMPEIFAKADIVCGPSRIDGW